MVLAIIPMAVAYIVYCFLRGRRNRDQGILCIECERLAFPLEGSTTRYRCWNCHLRFDGPEHN
jgi:hypothetical protein